MKQKAIIHVNRAHIAANLKDGGKRPVYTVKRGREITYAHGVTLTGMVRLIDPRERQPLSYGARAWIELIEGNIELTEPCSFAEAQRQIA